MLYKFYTPSCGACKTMSAYLHSKYPDLTICEVDASSLEQSELVHQYNIGAVPTLVDSETGKILVGFQPQRLDEFLGSRVSEMK